MPVKLALEMDERLPRSIETTCYFVVAEALANVAKHAGANQVSVRLSCANGRLLLEVEDDGRGGADPLGSGLRGLADRVAAVGGHLDVANVPGSGTRVSAEMPCA